MNCQDITPKTLKDILSFDGSDSSKGLQTIFCSVENIIKLALDFAFILSVIMILYSAFLYVTSNGEEAKAESAKKTLTWSIIGFVVIFSAQLIMSIIKKEIR